MKDQSNEPLSFYVLPFNSDFFLITACDQMPLQTVPDTAGVETGQCLATIDDTDVSYSRVLSLSDRVEFNGRNSGYFQGLSVSGELYIKRDGSDCIFVLDAPEPSFSLSTSEYAPLGAIETFYERSSPFILAVTPIAEAEFYACEGDDFDETTIRYAQSLEPAIRAAGYDLSLRPRDYDEVRLCYILVRFNSLFIRYETGEQTVTVAIIGNTYVQENAVRSSAALIPDAVP